MIYIYTYLNNKNLEETGRKYFNSYNEIIEIYIFYIGLF